MPPADVGRIVYVLRHFFVLGIGQIGQKVLIWMEIFDNIHEFFFNNQHYNNMVDKKGLGKIILGIKCTGGNTRVFSARVTYPGYISKRYDVSGVVGGFLGDGPSHDLSDTLDTTCMLHVTFLCTLT